MKVEFACDNCGSLFVIAAEFAGRTGRCRTCGHRMVIPTPASSEGPATDARESEAPQPVAVAPKPSASERSAPASPKSPAPRHYRPPNWSSALDSLTNLKPITADALPALRRRQDPESEFRRSTSCYGLVIPRELQKQLTGGNPAAQAVRAGYAQGVGLYRRFFDTLARIARWISETSYSLSMLFLILAIAVGMAHQHALAVLAITVIVLLNLLALAGGAVNLAMRGLRKSPVEAALVLVPPINVLYLWKNWATYRMAVGRIVRPLVSLCLVVVAYMFVPWLGGGQHGSVTLEGRVQGAVKSLEHDVGESTSQAVTKAKQASEGKVDLQAPVDQAKAALGKAQEMAESKLDQWKQKRGSATDGKASAGADARDAKP